MVSPEHAMFSPIISVLCFPQSYLEIELANSRGFGRSVSGFLTDGFRIPSVRSHHYWLGASIQSTAITRKPTLFVGV